MAESNLHHLGSVVWISKAYGQFLSQHADQDNGTSLGERRQGAKQEDQDAHDRRDC